MPEIHSRSSTLSLILIIFGHFLNHFLAYVLIVSLYIIRQDVPMTKAQSGLVSTVQLVITAVFTFIFGIIGDKWLPSKIVFIPLGVLLMALHLFIAGSANNFYLIILAATVVGLGASFYHPVAYAMIADLFEKKKGLTMSLNAAFGMIGTSIAPGIMGSLSKTIGWQTSFKIFGLISVLLSILLYFSFKFMISYKMSKEEISVINHRRITMSKKERIVDWFKSEFLGVLTFYIIICLIYGIFRAGIFRITNQFLPYIFNDFYGYNIKESGWMTTIILVVGGFTSILGGLMSDRFSTSLTMAVSSIGMTIMLLSIYLFAGIIVNFWGIIAVFFIYSAFLYFSAAAQTKYISENVPQNQRSTAIGVLFAISSSLTGIFPWFYGLIIDNAGYVISFLFIFILALIASILAIVMLLRDFAKLKQELKLIIQKKSRTK